MSKRKKGRVEIHWSGSRVHSGQQHGPDTQITLIKLNERGSSIPGFVFRLTKGDAGSSESYVAAGVELPPAKDSLTSRSPPEDVELLLERSSIQGRISEKRYRYIEGLVESIKLQSTKRKPSDADSSVYKLRIKRADMDIRLAWGDGEKVWPGVTDLVHALEETYSKLASKTTQINQV